MAFLKINSKLDFEPFTGEVCMNSLHESFISASSHWSVNDYLTHWKAMLSRALNGHDVCLVTSWSPVVDENGVSGEMWCIYWASDRDFRLQNKLILNNLYASDSNVIDPHAIDPGKHLTVDEEGDFISEWSGTVGDLKDLICSLSPSDEEKDEGQSPLSE